MRTGFGSQPIRTLAVGPVIGWAHRPRTADLYRLAATLCSRPAVARQAGLPAASPASSTGSVTTNSEGDEATRERELAEIRAHDELTWPVWGPNGDQLLYLQLDAGVIVLYECTRCCCVVTSCSGHEAAMHPDEPLREHGPFGGVTG